MALALFFLATLPIPQVSRAQEIAVDLELVLAIDSSRSIDTQEFDLQIKGIAAAFRDPAFLATLRSHAPRGIAVALVQWSGQNNHINALGWHHITDGISARIFANQIEATGRMLNPGSTSINNAIRYCSSLLQANGFNGARKVIDVSGDGYNNTGSPPELARDEAVARGITINGLTISNEVAQLHGYYKDRVIGGAGAFVMTALDFQEFSAVFRRKLIREVIGVKVYSWKQDLP
jgi:hypothetical protein